MDENSLKPYERYWTNTSRYTLGRSILPAPGWQFVFYGIYQRSDKSMVISHYHPVEEVEIRNKMLASGVIVVARDKSLLHEWVSNNIELTPGSLLPLSSDLRDFQTHPQHILEDYRVLWTKTDEYGLLFLTRTDGTSRYFIIDRIFNDPVVTDAAFFSTIVDRMKAANIMISTQLPA